MIAVVGAAAYFAQMTALFGFSTGSDDSKISEEFLDILLNGIKATS